jgi:murein L,D-transpeptidase YafK
MFKKFRKSIVTKLNKFYRLILLEQKVSTLNYNNSTQVSKYISFTILIILFSIISIFNTCTPKSRQPENNKDTSTLESVIPQRVKRSDYYTLINYNLTLKRIIDSLSFEKVKLEILIDKSEYILSLISDSVILKQYPIVLGQNPIDEKLMQGDMCTPEGNFKILSKSIHPIWKRFMLIDYPNEESLAKIKVAKEIAKLPKESKPGGEIGIQGVQNDSDYLIDYKVNWTLGCISMKNQDIIEIFDYVDVGTKVIIVK